MLPYLLGQNSSAHVARVVGLQTDSVVVTETRLNEKGSRLRVFSPTKYQHLCLIHVYLLKSKVLLGYCANDYCSRRDNAESQLQASKECCLASLSLLMCQTCELQELEEINHATVPYQCLLG